METRVKVRVLGVGCAKCKTLEYRVRQLVARHHLSVDVEKVTDLAEIMKYGVLATPALVIDEVVKCVGSVPKEELILTWLKGTTK